MKSRLRSLAFTLPALLFAVDATAARQPEYLDERPVETAAGARGRLVRATAWTAPAASARHWQNFVDAHGAWRALWDADAGVPLRIFGEGIAAPGANADAGKAELAARALLAEQLALLAPGASADDFALVANLVHGPAADLRTVGFVQVHRGLRVLGGQVSFLFKRDRVIVIGSEAAPRVDAAVPFAPIPANELLGRAQAWIEAAYGARPTLLADHGLAILPLVRDAGDDGAPRVEHRAVRVLTLDLADPRARWDVYLDAFDGTPIARRQTLMFGAGTLKFNTPVRYPRSDRRDDEAPLLNVTVSNVMSTTSATGGLTWEGTAAAMVQNGVRGTHVRVTTGNNGAGTPASSSMQVADGGTGVWNAAGQATVDAQLTGYIHANKIKAIARAELNPSLGWLDGQLQVNVNENGSCNAYSTGDDIHFFLGSGQCENTGRLPDVIYHEFGHSLHANSIIPGAGSFDTAMSEGVSDYLAATVVDDPGMGRGFFMANAGPLRHLDPSGEKRWPEDIDGDPHETGLIIGGALWDARKALIEEKGAVAGKQLADDWFYATLQRAADIPSTYVEVLAFDDDDGDLANGTPNKCLLDRTFAPHGLVDTELGLGIKPPVREGNDLTVEVATPPGGCQTPPVASVVVEWRPRGQGALQTVPFTLDGANYKASIPAQPDGTVVQYRVAVTMASGLRLEYPANLADPLYEYYVGELRPVYCTDFESDPFAAGWTHGRTVGNDDWEWGVPEGEPANGDPRTAASGTRVIGNDLAIGNRNGTYASNTSNWVMSPVIDVSHAVGVRLQYKRWLTVEDGFYDDAEVQADGVKVWSNFDTGNENATTAHTDREWRFHDLDLAAQAADGMVQIKFTLATDEGLEFGGWNLDDFCIMARTNIAPGCGDGTLGGSEQCDDGNNLAGDGCSESCTIEEGVDPPGDGGCCSTGGSPAGPLALGLFSLGLLGRRRRGRAA
jgi:MYXO-CTERM domain-containing protein